MREQQSPMVQCFLREMRELCQQFSLSLGYGEDGFQVYPWAEWRETQLLRALDQTLRYQAPASLLKAPASLLKAPTSMPRLDGARAGA